MRKLLKQTRNANRVQVMQNQWMIHQNSRAWKNTPRLVQQPAGPPPPGWYPDPTDKRFICWWDGGQWHPQSQRPYWNSF